MSCSITSQIIQRAAAVAKVIVLPESFDPRVIRAAATITKSAHTRVILLGEEQEIQHWAERH